MSKGRWGLLIITLVLILACSCGQKQATVPKEDEKGKESESQTQTYNLKMNVTFPPPIYDWEAKKLSTEEFARRVEEATEGQVKIKFYYNSQLAPTAQGLDALKKGVVDLWNGSSLWGGTVPESDVLWLPYGFMGGEHAMHVMRETNIGKILDEAYQKHGSHVLMYWPSGSMVIISKKPVKSLDDMKGMKVRLGCAIWKSWYQRMGSAPINVAIAEQYEALMRGTTDVIIYPEYTIDTYKFHEVCKYITMPAAVDPAVCYMLVSLNKWNSIPDELKKTIEKIALEIEKETIAASQRLSELALDNADKKGVQIIKLNKTEFEKFRGSVLPAWEEFAASSPQCAEMVKILRENIKKWEETRPEAKQWYEKWIG